MSKKTHIYGSEKQFIEKTLRQMAYKHDLWQVFQDFLAIFAFEFSASVDMSTRKERLAELQNISAKYSAAEKEQLAHCFGAVVMALEAGPQDVLGQLYMSLDLGNAWKGQFFTPDSVSQLIAEVTLSDAADKAISKWGFVSLNDPCVGGGAMVIGAVNSLLSRKINYQQALHVIATDIDIKSVHMAYLQLSLLHVPAIIIHGNSLTLEQHSIWYTPAHVMGGWNEKLKFRRAAEKTLDFLRQLDETNIDQVKPDQEKPANENLPEIYIPPDSVNVRQQMALF